MQENSDVSFKLNTVSGSLFHYIGNRHIRKKDKKWEPTLLRSLAIIICLTYLPMLISSLFLSPFHIYMPSEDVSLPFLIDVSTALMFLVSLPLIICFLLMDQIIVTDAIKDLLRDGLIVIENPRQEEFLSNWKKYFRRCNYFSQFFGSIISVFIVYLNYKAYVLGDLGFWISDGSHSLTIPGYFYLSSIFIFYLSVSIYTARTIMFSFFFYFLLEDDNDITVIPKHPDKCGGLRAIGNIGLRNQYLLTVLGVNLILYFIVSYRILSDISSLYSLVILAIYSYILVGPIVFLGPLLPFRKQMSRKKSDLQGKITRKLKKEVYEAIDNMPKNDADEEEIEHLLKLGSSIDELPVWPFDIGTGLKFVTAYIIPPLLGIVTPVVYTLVNKWIGAS